MEALSEIFAATEAMVITALGVFARIGAAAFLVPGIGERAVPVRVRLGAALAIALILAPMIRPLVAETPAGIAELAGLIAAEAASGLVIGLAFRLLIIALQTAGAVAAQHMSLSHMFGTGVAPEPEPTIATLLGLGGIVLALAAGLHVALIAALAQLYDVLPFGRAPKATDLAEWATENMAGTFAMGVALAFPFVAISFLYNLALGALSRAMPQLLVALVGVPLLVGLGLVTLYLSLPQIFDTWGGKLSRILALPLGGLG